MIGLMWRSMDHPGKLIFSPDLSLSRYQPPSRHMRPFPFHHFALWSFKAELDPLSHPCFIEGCKSLHVQDHSATCTLSTETVYCPVYAGKCLLSRIRPLSL